MNRVLAFTSALLMCCGIIQTMPLIDISNSIISYADDTVPTSGKSLSSNATWDYDTNTGTLTFTGEGQLNFTTDYYTFLEEYLTKIKSVIIQDGITDMPNFAGATQLESIEIPDSITSINPIALQGTPFLENYPEDFVILGDNILYAYKGDTNVSSIEIPSNVKTINSKVFESLSNLTEVTISNSVETICAFAFVDCPQLKSITIPDSVTTMEYFSVGFMYGLEGSNIKDWIIELSGNPLVAMDDFVIYGTYGSSAEEYSQKCDIKFYDINTNLDDNIINMGTCGENATWIMDKDYNVTISGTGAVDLSILAYANDIKNYFYNNENYIQKLTIEDGITEITSLRGFDYIKTLELTSSVTTINNCLFEEVNSIETIIAPKEIYLAEDYLMNVNFSSLQIYLTFPIRANFNIRTFFQQDDVFLINLKYTGNSDDTIINVLELKLSNTLLETKDNYIQRYAQAKGIEFIDVENQVTETTPNVSEPSITTTTEPIHIDKELDDTFLIQVLQLKKHILGVVTDYMEDLDYNSNGKIDIQDLILIKYLFLN